MQQQIHWSVKNQYPRKLQKRTNIFTSWKWCWLSVYFKELTKKSNLWSSNRSRVDNKKSPTPSWVYDSVIQILETSSHFLGTHNKGHFEASQSPKGMVLPLTCSFLSFLNDLAHENPSAKSCKKTVITVQRYIRLGPHGLNSLWGSESTGRTRRSRGVSVQRGSIRFHDLQTHHGGYVPLQGYSKCAACQRKFNFHKLTRQGIGVNVFCGQWRSDKLEYSNIQLRVSVHYNGISTTQNGQVVQSVSAPWGSQTLRSHQLQLDSTTETQIHKDMLNTTISRRAVIFIIS